MSAIDPTLLFKLNRPAPRYTSYPTAPMWEALTADIYEKKLKLLSQKDHPLSLYFHIPFCKTMCLYCGCSVVLNRKVENEALYVDYLIKEVDLVCSFLGTQRRVSQIHFGGGTPTQLSIPLFGRLYEKIQKMFSLDDAQEVAIEIDPRTVADDQGEKLHFLKSIGFNRVSFGVQDTNAKVQESVKRHQSLEMTLTTFELARRLGFKGINIDLIYGLPHQTTQTFDDTVSQILKMRPDRIAFFSYAKVPWLKPHQRAIKEETLPTVEEKFQIYAHARHRFIENGYIAIGMDHFALEDDELAIGYREHNLQRNFQGYSLKLSQDTLSFGITSIGFVGETYVQNLKDLKGYYQSLDSDRLPVYRGKILNAEDLLRKWVIHTLMCDFELDKRVFQEHFKMPFDVHFSDLFEPLACLERDGLIVNTSEKMSATPLGELFIRVVAMTFDAYLSKQLENQKFSQAV